MGLILGGLTPKQLEMQGCILSIVVIDALMLKQQTINPTVLIKLIGPWEISI